jgi:WD40 repeat protein
LQSFAVSPDGRYIVQTSSVQRVHVLDAQSGNAILGLEGLTTRVTSVALQDSDLVALGSVNGTIRVWAVETGVTFTGPFEGHTARVVCIAFSLNGQHIASGSWDKAVRIWNPRSGDFLLFRGHTTAICHRILI